MSKGMNWDKLRYSGKTFEPAFPTGSLADRRAMIRHARKVKPLTPAQIDQAKLLRRQGLGLRDIATNLDTTTTELHQALNTKPWK